MNPITRSKAFGKFVNFFMENPETGMIENEFAIDTAINSMSKNELILVKNDLAQLLENSHSDNELVKIWSSYTPQFVYMGKAQRLFMQEVYNAVEAAITDNTRMFLN
jgi:hypothetical protein